MEGISVVKTNRFTSQCASLPVRSADVASVNVTELLLERYRQTPKADLERLLKCWGYTDCGDCHRSEGHCGWCAVVSEPLISNLASRLDIDDVVNCNNSQTNNPSMMLVSPSQSTTCVPLPKDSFSRAFPLLAPVRHKNICSLGSERFELRTSGLGCQVSTITVLTSIVTIFATIFGLLVLYGLAKLLKWIVIAFMARNGGWRIHQDGTEEIWVRKSETWGKWWRRVSGEQKEFEVEEVDEGTPERSWFLWNTAGRQNGSTGERRALLD